jgi:serine/threonine protein kinase
MPEAKLVRELLLKWDEQTAATPEELCRPYSDRPDHGELLQAVREAIADLCAASPFIAASAHKAADSANRLPAAHEASMLGLEHAAPAPELDATGPFQQIVAVCEDFTGGWTPGDVSALQVCLDRVQPEGQPALFRNLLAADLQNRRAAGEHPSVDDYLARFPQFANVARDVFLEFSSASSVVSHDTVKPKIAASKMPSASRLGDYRLLGELGRGGMGVVYEACHVERGNHFALKMLPSAEGAALHRFKREFRALAGINHPNLVGLHTLEADGGQWFFTMDLVAGVNFLKYVRPAGILDEARLRSAFAQLATGVMALHGRNIIHRDLKPSNVMVTDGGQVVLMDFGLVAELDRTGMSASSDKVAGTPKYMAPEQAAASPPTPASDWYAVGVMLYEALSGKPPFGGPLMQVLQDKQRLDPPPLSGPNMPADLNSLCMRLLARAPQARPDAFEIAKAIASATKLSTATVSHTGQHLVGREPHLAALNDAFRALERNCEPVVEFISGRSGEGKTALAEHFLATLRKDKRIAVMSGRCYDRESVPFKALDTLIDALGSYLRSLPGKDAALLIPDDIGMLVQVFPVLQRVDVVAEVVDARPIALDDQQTRQRAFRALRSLLTRIGRRSQIVWFIDDLQWGDADSAEALFRVLRPPEAPAVLVLGTYRSDETESSAFLRMWKEQQRKHDVRFNDHEIKLAPLTVEECIELVIGLQGRRIYSPSRGRIFAGDGRQPALANRVGRLFRSRFRLFCADALARDAGNEAGKASVGSRPLA